MSLDDAIGQIDQILALQQQLADPSELASTLASGGTSSASSSGGAGLTTGTGNSAFAELLAANQASALTGSNEMTATGGLTGSGLSDSLLAALSGSPTTPTSGVPGTTGTTTGVTGTTTGVAGTTTGVAGTSAGSLADAPARLQAMVQEANSLLGKPYVWGGGHGGWGPQSGYDCSGFVSAVLHAGGYLSAPQDTQTLPGQPGILDGPGQYVTIYDRTDAGMSDNHVIIDIAGQFYESGGEHGAWGGGGGVEKIATPSQAYLATFNRVLHPEGL